MARLYSLAHAGSVDDPAHGHFEPGPHGGFDFPDELSDRLHPVHHRKKRVWETEEERGERLHGEESARRRDPETLYNAVADIANATKGLSGGHGVPADVLAEIAALRAEIAELRASSQPAPADGQDGDEDTDPDADAKPSPRRKPAAAKSGDPE